MKPASSAPVELRPATFEDATRLFVWRNLPEIVVQGKSRSTVSWEEHQSWLADVLQSENHLLCIALLESDPVGQIRFHRLDEHWADASIYLHPDYTGRGLGPEVLRLGCQRAAERWPEVSLRAVVRADNRRSISTFIKSGFKPLEKGDTSYAEYVELQLTRRKPE